MTNVLLNADNEIEPERFPPSVISPHWHRSPRDLEPVAITLHKGGAFDESGDSIDHLFEYVLKHRNVYLTVPDRGEFDSIFRSLGPNRLRWLALTGEVTFGDYIIRVYGRDGWLSIRKGNNWGSLSNAVRLCPWAKTPKEVRLGVELASMLFERYGFPGLSFRTPGQAIQEMCLSTVRWQRLPPDPHRWRFLQAFKGARMEGVVFGVSEVYDYDIKSAYPSFCAELPATNNMEWFDTPDIIEEASYAAILCDVDIPIKSLRPPIAVRVGERSVYFPVGILRGIWLSKPDIDLLLEFPSLGRIIKVYEGSWGVTKEPVYPFKLLMRRLYSLRNEQELFAQFTKLSMAALWGKFISRYQVIKDLDTGESWTQSSPLYNPIFASHVTSQMRSKLYRMSMGKGVVGEFVDGVSVKRPMETEDKFGGLVEKGRGTMLLLSDQYKAASWKEDDGLFDIAHFQRDARDLEIPRSFKHTLASSWERGGLKGMSFLLGKSYDFTDRLAIGSSTRMLLENDLKVGHLLDGHVSSVPVPFEHLKMFRIVRGLWRQASATFSEVQL